MKLNIEPNGDHIWYNDKGQPHNIIGPAFATNGFELWYKNALRHRLDGPAEECIITDTHWWWLGECISQQQHTLISNVRFFTRRVEI